MIESRCLSAAGADGRIQQYGIRALPGTPRVVPRLGGVSYREAGETIRRVGENHYELLHDGRGNPDYSSNPRAA